MKLVFLTAYRNEQRTLGAFLDEFAAVLGKSGLRERAVLYAVDDLSVDGSARVIEQKAAELGLDVRVIAAPSNFGNQGAMFYGLQRIDAGPDDVVVTFDSDGEDDVKSIPELLELGNDNPGRLVLVERGRRHESLVFKVCFGVYKLLFRFLTGRTVIPNNFMLIPGRYLAPIRRSPLAAVHLAYGILRLGFPHVTTTRDRRPRYGGSSSQNLFMLVSHGMVGLMVFYEVVVAKLFVLLFSLLAVALALVTAVIVLPATCEPWQHALQGALVATAAGTAALLALLVSAALALIFKVGMFTVVQGQPYVPPASAPTPGPTPPSRLEATDPITPAPPPGGAPRA